MGVKVLFDGQPLSAPVLATYDGFSAEKNTYAYDTEAKADGTARVRITRPGLWMVRVEAAKAEAAATHDRYLARAVLVFEVK